MIPIPNKSNNPGFQMSVTERTTTAMSYTKVKDIKVSRSGYYICEFALKGSTDSEFVTGYARIYKNGVALGTERVVHYTSYVIYYEKLFFEAGSYAQLYCKSDGTQNPTIKDFSISYCDTEMVVVTD